MKKELFIKVAVVFVVFAISAYLSYPPFDTGSQKGKLSLGLDLKGGVQLVWELDKAKLSQMGLSDTLRQDSVNRAVEVMRNRVDGLGVKEPQIYAQGTDRIVVQLPGLDDPQEAIKTIGDVAFLEFRLVNDDQQKLTEAINGKAPLGWELKYEVDVNDRGEKNEVPILVKAKPALTGELLENASVDVSSFGIPDIGLKFRPEGAKRFSKVTGENIGKRLAILLDDKVITAPTIRTAITNGRASIQGKFTSEEAQRLARQLSGGALPVPLVLADNRSVSPSLGADSIHDSVMAGIIGFCAVVAFMAVYYCLSGMLADFALFLNLLIITGIMSAFGLTLTLPGIAGIILTLGMAVDANVLINERIREELGLGKTVHSAIEAGFKRAFVTILDSNATTILTAMFLFQFGTGPIKGFAITLTIGLLASMFTAVFVVRVIFDLLMSKIEIKKLRMLQLFKRTNIDFVANMKKIIPVSIAILVIGMVWFIVRGNGNFGIDFKGGTLLQISTTKPIVIDELRKTMAEIGESNATLQYIGSENKDVLIRTDSPSYDKMFNDLQKKYPDYGIKRERTEYVGPTVGAELRQRALLALIFSLGGLLVYISWRFEFRFALGAVIALVHDVLITMGIFAMSGREISLTYVAAMLTMVGFSINDTIVVYDRIRENVGLNKKGNMASIINTSVNQTLSRTVLTSLTAILVLVSLFVFGGEVINDFAFILIIGIVTGTYSSVFIASPIVLILEKVKKS